MGLAGPGRLGVVVFDLVGQDRHQIAVGEPFDGRRGAQRPIDLGGADDTFATVKPPPATTYRGAQATVGYRFDHTWFREALKNLLPFCSHR